MTFQNFPFPGNPVEPDDDQDVENCQGDDRSEPETTNFANYRKEETLKLAQSILSFCWDSEEL